MAKIILITGGTRSGKSSLAVRWAAEADHRVFIATAEAFDDEMRARIAHHRAERGAGWRTLEAPWDLPAAISGVMEERAVIVVDCLTVWLGNLMHRQPSTTEDSPPCHALMEALRESPAGTIIVVTNEVGMGIVPVHPLGRHFRDVAGRLNQRIACLADRVVLVVCGQALDIKPSPTIRQP